jgi:dihydroorotase
LVVNNYLEERVIHNVIAKLYGAIEPGKLITEHCLLWDQVSSVAVWNQVNGSVAVWHQVSSVAVWNQVSSIAVWNPG